MNNELFFAASGDLVGNELYRTDGTTAGTVLVSTAIDWSDAFSALGANGILFRGFNVATGAELWRSDGTAAGTMIVDDINTLPASATKSSSPDNLLDHHGTTFFAADDGSTGIELWKTDGTAAGTVSLGDLMPPAPGNYGGHLYPRHLTSVGQDVYFVGQSQFDRPGLYRTDGTPTGTQLLRQLDFAPDSKDAPSLAELDSRLYLLGKDANSSLFSLWMTDGSVAGTQALSSGVTCTSLVRLRDRLFFSGRDDQGAELWVSDGTGGGTRQVQDLYPGSFGSSPSYLTAFGDLLVFTARDPNSEIEPMVCDAGSLTIRLLRDIHPNGSSSSNSYTVVGDKLFFAADNGVGGRELWVSNGTRQGTVLVKDIRPGATGSIHHSETGFVNFDDRMLLFHADDGVHGRELWMSDGTPTGTVMIRDVDAGPGSSVIGSPVATGSRFAYFLANDGVAGLEVWVTDLTTAGTKLLTDTVPGPHGLLVNSRNIGDLDILTMSNGSLLLSADLGREGLELVTIPLDASAQVFGRGCAQGRPPELRASDPIQGGRLRVSVRSFEPVTTGALVLGARSSAPPFAGNCQLYFDTQAVLFVPPFSLVNGARVLDFPISNTPALAGLSLNFQAAVGPTTSGPFGLDLTNGVAITMGK